MNTQRITVSIPKYLYDQLVAVVSTRKVSKYVARALERQLLEEKDKDPINEFTSLREKLPKIPRKAILAGIKKGRQ
ncbi:MAG: hypothetical protein ACC618_03060 [Patescibacteria group bacterium]